MKEELETILLGVVFLVAAFLTPRVLDGFIFYLFDLIPLTETVIAWFFGIVGALAILVGILDKKKD